MKVDIGPFLNFWGPYQIVDLLQKVGISEDRRHRMGEWLADTWIEPILQDIHIKRKRKEKVIIHDYDAWDGDRTLAIIILPLLKKIKEEKQGAPFVDDEDVPPELRKCAAPPVNDYVTDENWFLRYDYILDQMIWAFEKIVDHEWETEFHHGVHDNNSYWFDKTGYEAVNIKIQNGLYLFGKYYRTLWV